MTHWTKTSAREETLRKIKEARARQVFSKESQIKKALSIIKYNKEHPEVQINKGIKISIKKMGHEVSPETRKKIKIKNLGKRYSPKTEFKKGLIPWNKGLKGKYSLPSGKITPIEVRMKQSKIRKDNILNGKIKVLRGHEHPHWLGGKSFEPYNHKFNAEFKRLVRLRDNYCCLNCGLSEQVSLIIRNRKLTIHHIDYNKLNTCLQNCCTLCTTCNNQANFNRSNWTTYYQGILSSRYNYNYNKMEIIN